MHARVCILLKRSAKFLLLQWLLLTAHCLYAQKPASFFYTSESEKYFSDKEMDSLLEAYTHDLFREAMIPDSLFEKVYSLKKSILVYRISPPVTAAFKSLEKTNPGTLKPVKGTTAFEQRREAYRSLFQQQVRKVFTSTTGLREYLDLTGSDRISFFHSLVSVLPNGQLRVTETIRIYNGNGSRNPLYGALPAREAAAVNNEIIRGIVRTFPLYYVNKYRLFQNTTFKLETVLKDGKTEDYHTEKKNNGILLYIGNRNVSLPNGYYTYTITYVTDNQLKLLSNFDELYWNVTGNGWSFKIDSAQSTVLLPAGASLLSAHCYTGSQGSRDENCAYTMTQRGDSVLLRFKTTQSLLPKQGLTIAVSWPKGFVTGPSAWQRFKRMIWSNKAVFFFPIAILFSAIFCFFYWIKYGRDPEKGTVYPLFEPVPGYSPAAMGYIYAKRYTRRLTAATIVDAAVRNKITIDVEREGKVFKHNTYYIKEPGTKAKKISAAYESFDSDIEDLVNTSIRKGKYNSELGDLNSTVEKYCIDNFKNKDGGFRKGYRGFFATNASYTILPILVCIVAGGWGFIALMKAFVLRNFAQGIYYVGGLLLCILILNIFSKLLEAYSPEGRKLMDKIEGFRMFLSTADESRFDLMNPPEKTLALYEKYLPFAIALGCEIEWGKRFESIIDSAYLDGSATSSFSQSVTRDHNFSSSFSSSFSGAIVSASTPPSSSSGGGSSFGGGSSGGGGGGGGGGGW